MAHTLPHALERSKTRGNTYACANVVLDFASAIGDFGHGYRPCSKFFVVVHGIYGSLGICGVVWSQIVMQVTAGSTAISAIEMSSVFVMTRRQARAV